jgi:hypothetical protein
MSGGSDAPGNSNARARPQGEAIHTGTPDGFTLRDDGANFPSSLRGMKQSASTLKERFALLRTSQSLIMNPPSLRTQ